MSANPVARGGTRAAGFPEPGPAFLVEERGSCGVGFIANTCGTGTHNLVETGLRALGCMEHRGACLSDNVSGDGSGILTAIPWGLLESEGAFISLPPREQRALGMVFLPRDDEAAARCRQVIEEDFGRDGISFNGWRTVPVDPSLLGKEALENQPQIVQFAVSSEVGVEPDELERILYLRRRHAARTLVNEGLSWQKDMYFCSVSVRTVVYKGMTNASALGKFYLDLSNPAYESNFCLYHRRFSTNTMPRWPLAQPMRMLGHNGEINTLLGNLNWVRAREANLGTRNKDFHPTDPKSIIELTDTQDDAEFEDVVDNGKSDSANLDSVFELLVQSGKGPAEALMVMVPEAYRGQPQLDERPAVLDFYKFWEAQQEPWDGPALLVWSDGKKVGACLDRNGLRPARFLVTRSGMVCMMSETGVVPVDDCDIVMKGRLGPGQMIACDLEDGRFLDNWAIKEIVAARRPYGEWVNAHASALPSEPFEDEKLLTDEELLVQQAAFGWSSEDVDMQIADMAGSGKETTFSMGDDIPLAVLSERPHVLYDYFKQRFAQVTNPPIDPLREGAVMSLEMFIGRKGNPMKPIGPDARQLQISTPILNEQELAGIAKAGFSTSYLSTLYSIALGPEGLEQATNELASAAVEAVRDGAEVVVLTDRGGINAEMTYIPPLLAVGAVHHRLIEAGLRMDASIIIDTAQAWGTHHIAALIGYGASAVHPRLALESVRAWLSSKRVQQMMEDGRLPKVSPQKAQANFREALESGLLKIMSKMGISMLSSYQGAQIFEAIGIGKDLLELGFRGTPSRLGGICIADLASETMQFVETALAADERTKLVNYGYVQFYRSGEYHHNSPILMKSLHKAIRAGPGAFDLYELYMQSVRSRPLTSLRDLLEIKSDREPIPIEEVEPADKVMERFCTGGMSLGALSREAHETMAIGVNRVGGKSNSGEGGEDPVRFRPIEDVDADGKSKSFPHLNGLQNGDMAASAIKQVASGRFGVTPEYLMSARQIEIKIAQGAKPGEGGQLPGPKISEYIAGLRASKPGVTLISPPPHHDIYSIEDLAQLIFDLHQINPSAGVSVKLVSEVGIGTIAAGVAKANADIIQISGHDGGTGASPLSSIKHAGSPWELGIAEVHRTLLQNNLRSRTLLRVDGGLKTGLDIVLAALMGAEEFGFGTVAMIAEGCIMARICHTNNCPVGVTTQREDLRKKFPGTPDNIATFFKFVAEEVRLLLAQMGYKSLTDLMGRADLLTARKDLTLKKAEMLNLDFLTRLPDVSRAEQRTWLDHGPVHENGPVLDDDLLNNEEVKAAITSAGKVTVDLPIVNTDRSVGARVAGVLASQWGNVGFERSGGSMTLNFKGSAGQSFGAFNLGGMELNLIGEANDYVAKGMNGGVISIMPPADAGYIASETVVVGNTCLYGATGGKLFIKGRAGERFAVRNSAGDAVVEGCGDHALEYMTGGVVVVLGPCGRNIAAGMTGGIAYLLDERAEGQFERRLNGDTVKIQRVATKEGIQQLRDLLEQHKERTNSDRAAEILGNFDSFLPKFWQIVPAAEANTPVASLEASNKEQHTQAQTSVSHSNAVVGKAGGSPVAAAA